MYINKNGYFKNGLMEDFSQYIYICTDKIKDKGEDSYFYSFNDRMGAIAVFDGLGGGGSQIYDELDGKSGAYIASRIVSEASAELFYEISQDESFEQREINTFLVKYINDKYKILNPYETQSRLKSSMIKSFPTTLTMCLFRKMNNNKLFINVLWGGDSRAFFMDEMGLHLLTRDDVDNPDDLNNDGIMTNVISMSTSYIIHEYTIDSIKKGVFIVSTDGGFGYFKTPINFEYIILLTLIDAESMVEVEEKIKDEINKYTGDDATLVIAVFGFDSFSELKAFYYSRYKLVKNKYIAAFNEPGDFKIDSLWSEYKIEYERIRKKYFE